MISGVRNTPNARALVLTHLTQRSPGAARKLRNCIRFWNDPEVRKQIPYRLYLHNAAELHELEIRDPAIERVAYSESGALDASTCRQQTGGFLVEERNLFVLGGGFMDLCLVETFRSIMETKAAQARAVKFLLPLPLIYHFELMDIMGFIQGKKIKNINKSYIQILRSSRSNYVVTLNQQWLEKRGSDHDVELHWFTSLAHVRGSGLLPLPMVQDII